MQDREPARALARVLLIGLACLAALIALTISVDSDPASAESTASHTLFLPLVNRSVPLRDPILVPYTVLNGFGNITITGLAGDPLGNLYATTQNGFIWRIVPAADGLSGAPGATPFMHLGDKVAVTNWEEGLLGIVFHPQFATNGYFYVTYTDPEHRLTLARYSAEAPDFTKGVISSETILLQLEKPTYVKPDGSTDVSRVHNAGDLHFGPDGYLYVAIGDGGPDPVDIPDRPADRFDNGQRLDLLFGKLLRLDVNGGGAAPDCGSGAYTVPPTNPFVDGSGGACDEIWSTGWRNPWRFSIDSLTGHLFIADVGEYFREEINVEPPGAGGRNYGWRCYEGTVQRTNECDPAALTFPAYEYANDEATAASVIGGYVYRGDRYPTLRGWYLFTDFEGRSIKALSADNPTDPPRTLIPVQDGWPRWTTFGQDAAGDIYLGALYNETLFKIVVPDS